MARHVVLLRRDPSLGLALRALLAGTGRVTDLDDLQAWSTVPADSIDAVVIDLPDPARRHAIELVRSRFDGRLVLVLDPTDGPAAVPTRHRCSILRRPFEIAELWHLVTTDPGPGEQERGAGPEKGRAGPTGPAQGLDAPISQPAPTPTGDDPTVPGAPEQARPPAADASTWRWRGRRYGPATAIPPDPSGGAAGTGAEPGSAPARGGEGLPRRSAESRPGPRTTRGAGQPGETAGAGDTPAGATARGDAPTRRARPAGPGGAGPAASGGTQGRRRPEPANGTPAPGEPAGGSSAAARPPGGASPAPPSATSRPTTGVSDQGSTRGPAAPKQTRASGRPAPRPVPPPTADRAFGGDVPTGPGRRPAPSPTGGPLRSRPAPPAAPAEDAGADRPSLLRRLTGRLGGRKPEVEAPPEAPTDVRSASVPAFEPAPPPPRGAPGRPGDPQVWPTPADQSRAAREPVTGPAAEPPEAVAASASGEPPEPAATPPPAAEPAPPQPWRLSEPEPAAGPEATPASAPPGRAPRRPARPERPIRPTKPRPAAESPARPGRSPRRADPASRGRRPPRDLPEQPAPPAPQRDADAPAARERARPARGDGPRAAPPEEGARPSREGTPPPPAPKEQAQPSSEEPAAAAVPDDPRDAVAAVDKADDQAKERSPTPAARADAADPAAVEAAATAAPVPLDQAAAPSSAAPDSRRRTGRQGAGGTPASVPPRPTPAGERDRPRPRQPAARPQQPPAAPPVVAASAAQPAVPSGGGPAEREPEPAAKPRPGSGPLGVAPDAPEALLAAEEVAGAPPGPTPGTVASPPGGAPPDAAGVDPATGEPASERRNRARRARSLLRFTAPRRPEHTEREDAAAPDAPTPPLADFDRLTQSIESVTEALGGQPLEFYERDLPQIAAAETARRVRADVVVLLLDNGEGLMEVSGGVGLTPAERRLSVEYSRDVMRELFRAGVGLIEDTDRVRGALAGIPGSRAETLVMVPLVHERLGFGVLMAGRNRSQTGVPTEVFADAEIEVLMGFADAAAASLRTAVLLRHLKGQLRALEEDG